MSVTSTWPRTSRGMHWDLLCTSVYTTSNASYSPEWTVSQNSAWSRWTLRSHLQCYVTPIKADFSLSGIGDYKAEMNVLVALLRAMPLHILAPMKLVSPPVAIRLISLYSSKKKTWTNPSYQPMTEHEGTQLSLWMSVLKFRWVL